MVTKSKKGQGLSTSTVVLLVLGLIILVILVWGFITGWSAFRGFVNPTNVDTVIQECSQACSLNSEYSYCLAEKTLNVNEDSLNAKTSCAVFSTEKAFAKYKIPPCPTVTCDLKCSEIVINGRKGNSSATTGKYDLSDLAKESNCYVD